MGRTGGAASQKTMTSRRAFARSSALTSRFNLPERVRAELRVRIQAPLGRGLAAGPEIARPEAMSRSYRAEWGAAGRDPAPGSGLALGLLECPVKGRANPARAVGAAIDWRLC